MQITAAQLRQVTLNDRFADVVVKAFNANAPRFGLNNVARTAVFLGQTSHESVDFTAGRENTNYTSAIRLNQIFRTNFPTVQSALPYVGKPVQIANRAYANRGGNGPENSGDGWKFRGGGWIQLTFRDGYAACARGTGIDFLNHPELIEQPEHACVSAMWWWSVHGLNQLADQGSLNRITRIINGPAMLGLSDRLVRTERARAALQG
jgi:putative chitinase